MKKIVTAILLFASTCMLFNCSDDSFTEKYKDPTKASEISIEKLMTGVFLRSRDFSMAGYVRYFAYDNLFLGKFSQTFGFYNSAGMYTPGFMPYTENAYYNFYNALTDFRALEKLYDALDEGGKKDNDAYYWAAKVHLLDQFIAVSDVHGDMPWNDACKITITGNPNDVSAKFDKAQDNYKMTLDELKKANEVFASMGATPSLFPAQDFINEGDVMKWRRYINSIRLRIAMRVSTNGPLASEGQAVVKEILGNASTYPVVESNEQNIQIWNRETGSLNQEGGGGFDWAECRLAAGPLINRMLSKGSYVEDKAGSGLYVEGTDDPRLPILYTLAVPDGSAVDVDNNKIPSVFRGTDPTMSQSLLLTLSGGAGFSHVRQDGFFWRNKKWDHQLFSAAEYWFIKAEAIQRGWVDGNAKDAFKRAISESISFYFKYQNNRSQKESADEKNRYHYVVDPKEPTAAEISAFAEARWEAPISNMYPYADKLDAIITQKWINFSILFVREAWNDIRRTGYPSGLVYPNDPGATITSVPHRWIYPPRERSYNKYYSEVVTQDTYYTKLFWAK